MNPRTSATARLLIALAFLSPVSVRAIVPTTTTLAVSGLTYNSVLLKGSVNPNNLSSFAFFTWGTSTNYGTNTVLVFLSGNTAQSISNQLTSLAPHTTYHVRAVASNSDGYGYGNDIVFTTPSNPIPSAVTLTVSNLTYNGATLVGTVNPNGLSANAFFTWGTTTNYGTNTVINFLSGDTPQPISSVLSGLAPHTTYHYQTVASTTAGYGLGNDIAFTTPSNPPPTVTTLVAANVTSTGATLNASVNPNGLATTAFFSWGTTTNYGTNTVRIFLAGNNPPSITNVLSGLAPNTMYHYRAVASNSAGYGYGDDATFTTSLIATSHIDSITAGTNEDFLLHFTGQPDVIYSLQYSLDLSNWTTLAPVTLDGDGTFQSDIFPGGYSKMYFRLSYP